MSALVIFLFLSFFPFFIVNVFVIVVDRTAVDLATEPLVATAGVDFPDGCCTCCCDKRRRSKHHKSDINLCYIIIFEFKNVHTSFLRFNPQIFFYGHQKIICLCFICKIKPYATFLLSSISINCSAEFNNKKFNSHLPQKCESMVLVHSNQKSCTTLAPR